MRLMMLVVLSAVLAGGCKWKKEAEALAEKVEATEAVVAERDATIAEQEAEITSLTAKIADLESSIAGLEADLAAEQERKAQYLADKGALKNEIAQMKQALDELRQRKEQAESRVKQFKALVARFQALIDAGKLEVRIVDGRMVVVLGTDVLFASGAADLKEEGKAAIAEVATILREFPDRRFQVEGHTDNVPINSSRYPSNWYLAAARAIGVLDSLTSNGMSAKMVSAASFGDTRPVATNDDAEGRAKNRRIEIVVVPDLSDLPGYDELNKL